MCRSSEEARERLVTNFEADKPAAHFAELYQADGLHGGHVIMLGPDPDSRYAVTFCEHLYFVVEDEQYASHVKPQDSEACM